VRKWQLRRRSLMPADRDLPPMPKPGSESPREGTRGGWVSSLPSIEIWRSNGVGRRCDGRGNRRRSSDRGREFVVAAARLVHSVHPSISPATACDKPDRDQPQGIDWQLSSRHNLNRQQERPRPATSCGNTIGWPSRAPRRCGLPTNRESAHPTAGNTDDPTDVAQRT